MKILFFLSYYNRNDTSTQWYSDIKTSLRFFLSNQASCEYCPWASQKANRQYMNILLTQQIQYNNTDVIQVLHARQSLGMDGIAYRALHNIAWYLWPNAKKVKIMVLGTIKYLIISHKSFCDIFSFIFPHILEGV